MHYALGLEINDLMKAGEIDYSFWFFMRAKVSKPLSLKLITPYHLDEQANTRTLSHTHTHLNSCMIT